MGDSVDPKLAISIKKTQELLGKYVKKPPLSEKNLSRPPFRFLHDVITTVITSTGFLNGILSPDEMDSTKLTAKEAKNSFMQKIINAIKDATGEQLTAKASKILAGQEPEKTNELLQAFARAVEKNGGGTDGGKTAIGKQITGAKAKGKEPPVPSKDRKPVVKANPVKTEGPRAKKPGQGAAKKAHVTSPVKPKPDEKAKNTIRDPSPAKKSVVDDNKASGSRSVGKTSAPKTTLDTKPSAANTQDLGPSGSSTIQNENEPTTTGASLINRGSAMKRQNSSLRITTAESGQPLDESIENPSTSTGEGGQKASKAREEIDFESNELHVMMYDDFKNTSMKPNMETLSVPTSPIMSDSSVMQLGLAPESSGITIRENADDNINLDNPDTFERSANFNGPGPSSRVNNYEDNMDPLDGFGQVDQVAESGPGNVQTRNRTGTSKSRISSSRPPSARPAPPRPRSSVFKEAEESNYRPTTGKVSNVMLDSSDTQDDDDNFVIRETTVLKGLGLSDLDETPELALTSDADIKLGEPMDDLLPPEQRGLLVNQILETQKELEDKEKDGGKSDLPADRSKTREVTLAEIEKLKNLIQVCARSANPLGKLLDYVREDMDAMQKELSKWREESRQLDIELESTKQATEASLQPLLQQLKDVEVRIQDKEDAIASTKMAILKHQERIEKILSGLDRVQSSHGKIVIPSASQLMQQKTNSSPFIDDPNPILIDERPSTSSAFGNTLNRLSKSSAGMRPIFTPSEDLDPDHFNPWKE